MGFQLIKNFLWEKRNRVLWKSAENLRKSQNQTEIAWRIMTDIANDFQETFRPIQCIGHVFHIDVKIQIVADNLVTWDVFFNLFLCDVAGFNWMTYTFYNCNSDHCFKTSHNFFHRVYSCLILKQVLYHLIWCGHPTKQLQTGHIQCCDFIFQSIRHCQTHFFSSFLLEDDVLKFTNGRLKAKIHGVF